MTTHEMILLCSFLQVSADAFLCVWFWVCHFCSFWKIWLPPTYGLKHAAVCRSTAIFSWEPLVLDDERGSSNTRQRKGGGYGATM